MVGWIPAGWGRRRAAALREGRGPAQARQGLPTRLLFLFDPFKNYSLQIPGQRREEKLGGRTTEKAARCKAGTPGPGGLRSDPQQPPARAELQWPLQEASVSARRSGSTAPRRPPGTSKLRRAGDGRPLSRHSVSRPQPSAWPRARSCTAKSPRAGTACSARAPSSMDRRWTCSCPWASPAPARKSPAWAPATLDFAPARRPGAA